MSEKLSPNTTAILLLTAPLIAGRAKASPDLLTPGEYNKLARRLHELERRPADLLGPDADALLADCDPVLDRARLERLLARGFLLSQAVDRWQKRAIWIVSRADDAYPRRLKARLKGSSPAVLYGCGDRTILDTGGLAVVGSRNVDDALTEYTIDVGRVAARAERTLVSGGARGIDQAAMRGALESGGRAAGVLANGLAQAAVNRENRGWLMDGQLVLVSPYDPGAGFHVGHAMQRNKAVYALADAALVVSADLDKGGTWAGATEQLRKLRLVPVYVRATGDASPGLEALRAKGALPWPDPRDAEGLIAALQAPAPTAPPVANQGGLGFDDEGDDEGNDDRVSEPAPASSSDLADELFAKVRSLILRLLAQPKKTAEVASALGVTRRQAEDWMRRLVEEGVIEKRAKPVSYVVSRFFGEGGPGAS